MEKQHTTSQTQSRDPIAIGILADTILPHFEDLEPNFHDEDVLSVWNFLDYLVEVNCVIYGQREKVNRNSGDLYTVSAAFVDYPGSTTQTVRHELEVLLDFRHTASPQQKVKWFSGKLMTMLTVKDHSPQDCTDSVNKMFNGSEQ